MPSTGPLDDPFAHALNEPIATGLFQDYRCDDEDFDLEFVDYPKRLSSSLSPAMIAQGATLLSPSPPSHRSSYSSESPSPPVGGVTNGLDWNPPCDSQFDSLFDFSSASSSPPADSGAFQAAANPTHACNGGPSVGTVDNVETGRLRVYSNNYSDDLQHTLDANELMRVSHNAPAQESSLGAQMVPPLCDHDPPWNPCRSFTGWLAKVYNGPRFSMATFPLPLHDLPWQSPLGASEQYHMPGQSSHLALQAQQVPPAKPQLGIHRTPEKSRVETQIPIKLSVVNLPLGIKRVHLPTHTVSKAKMLAKPPVERCSDMLELYTMLVRTSVMKIEDKKIAAFKRAREASHPTPRIRPVQSDEDKPQEGGEVLICQGCITRERKRAARKKNKKPEEDELWDSFEHNRAIVFNTHEVKEWQPGQDMPFTANRPPRTMEVDVPMRIACYCRHHGEKEGFQVIFTLKDDKDAVLCQAISASIMITDDHKTNDKVNDRDGVTMSGLVGTQPLSTRALPFRQTQSTSDLQILAHDGSSRPLDSFSIAGPQARPVMAKPRNLSRPASPSPCEPSSKRRKASGSGSKIPSGLAMTKIETVQPAATTHMPAHPQALTPFYTPVHTPISPTGPTQMPFEAQEGMYSAATGFSVASRPGQMPVPIINKIVPGDGPQSGGVDVVILGTGFTNDGLEVYFGPNKATTTTYWSESTLACLLPPSATVGPVLVTVRKPFVPDSSFGPPRPHTMFTYRDEYEEQLGRLALKVLAKKFQGENGEMGDMDMARRILSGETSQGGLGRAAGLGSQHAGQLYQHECLRAHSLESGLLRVLDLIGLDDSVKGFRINVKGHTGQTMLHLACSLGMMRFIAALLSRGANVSAVDRGGFTPLHFAALNSHAEIVRRLIVSGADPATRSLSGLKPADVAQSGEIKRVLRRAEVHWGGVSGESLRTRARSATSLRSLWDTPAMTASGPGPTPAPVDTADDDMGKKGADEDEKEDESHEALMSSHASVCLDHVHLSSEMASSESEKSPARLAANVAMAVVREHMSTQVQHLQQMMVTRLADFAQLPLPQLLHDYHVSNAAVMQRIASFVPNMGGSRQGPVDDHQAGDEDEKEAPPSYAELFPRSDVETKQATGNETAGTAGTAGTTAEYEADERCPEVLDDDLGSDGMPMVQKEETSTLLRIRRKDAITKEDVENIQRVHAQNFKPWWHDKKLFFWFTALCLILLLMWWSSISDGVCIMVDFVNKMKSVKARRIEAVNGQGLL